jgi:hypothetical protein
MSTAPVTSQATPQPAARTYIGWQQEKVAFIFGLSAQRSVTTAAALLAAILPIAASRPKEGIVTWPIAAVLTLAAFARIGGRTADEWLTAAVSYKIGAFRRQHTFASGPFAPLPAGGQDGPPSMDLPGILAPLRGAARSRIPIPGGKPGY